MGVKKIFLFSTAAEIFATLRRHPEPALLKNCGGAV